MKSGVCIVVSAVVIALVGSPWVLPADEPPTTQPAGGEAPAEPAAVQPGQMPTTAPSEEAMNQKDKPKIADRVYVKMETTLGDVVLELNREKAPITVENFLAYADEGFYDGTIFHRVIPTFVIQGGGFDKDMKQKPTRAGIQNEWQNGLKNSRGTISMARQGNRPDSANSQFFINVKDNPTLNIPRDGAGYAVFGKVIQGMDVVDKIKDVPTARKGGHADVPVDPVIVNRVTRVEADDLKDVIVAAQAEEAQAAAKQADERAKQQEEEAQSFASDWNRGLEFIKNRGVDITKGRVSQSGLWHMDLVEGSGPSPAPTDQSKVHYTGWLVDGTKFDSSHDHAGPATFRLDSVIKGWTEGVGGMKVGGKRYLLIPPELGYGDRGAPPKIPPKAILVFEVELLAINE